MRLTAVQYASSPGDLPVNVGRHVAAVERAAALGTDAVLFPELSLIGYEPRFAAATATAPDDPRLAPLQAASDRFDLLVAVGAFADGVVGGRSAVWRADGSLAASLDATGEGLVCVDTDLD